jgi:hypothetical protein
MRHDIRERCKYEGHMLTVRKPCSVTNWKTQKHWSVVMCGKHLGFMKVVQCLYKQWSDLRGLCAGWPSNLADIVCWLCTRDPSIRSFCKHLELWELTSQQERETASDYNGFYADSVPETSILLQRTEYANTENDGNMFIQPFEAQW